MTLSRKFWEKMAERLFDEWDACEDPYGLPITEFKTAHAKVEQACTISMMLNTMDNEVKKAREGRKADE